MNTFYLWSQHNQTILAGAIGLIGLVGGIFIPGNKLWAAIRLAGFSTSQFIRRALGQKVEVFVEKVTDEFDAGLHSDEKITITTASKTTITTESKSIPAPQPADVPLPEADVETYNKIVG